MFFFLYARPQGIFISGYVGGVWMNDKHDYQRENLKLGAKREARNELIKNRLALFPKEKDQFKAIDTFGTSLKGIITNEYLLRDIVSL